jgi:hypothetical protein
VTGRTNPGSFGEKEIQLARTGPGVTPAKEIVMVATADRAAPAKMAGRQRLTVLLLLGTGFMLAADFSIMNVALPINSRETLAQEGRRRPPGNNEGENHDG